MNINDKALAGRNRKGFVNHSNHFHGDQTASLHYMQTGSLKQCRNKNCRSDYMRFASADGICIRCQQQVEFLVRERPALINRAYRNFREVTR